ncbi:MAG: MotA/TolQ/ExbB proton channel family protein, partial [Flavitalea sp.]
MNWFFLQIDSVSRLAQAATTVQPEQKVSLIDLLSKGGVLMIPLAILLVVAIFVFIERLIYIRKASRLE